MMFENMEYDSLGSVRELQAALFPPIVTRTISSVVTETAMTLGGLPLQPSRVNIDSPFQRSQSQPGERLKEPKQLFPVTPLQAARWPIECQVIEERVQHIDYVPPSPEPYYEPTELEAQPQPVGAEDGLVVFEYHPISPVSYFTRSCVGGSRPTTPTMQPAQYDGLRFESRFESGNLGKAICITQTYYELHLRADLYTNRHQQWFYFMVANMKRNIPYRFSIVNLFKGESLYNEGMKPLLYSTRDAQLHSIGWRRYGHNISYYANECPENSGDQQITYTLTFTMEFPHDNDEVYLAHSYPYTYSDLQDYLMRIASHPIKSSYTTLRLLCRSIAGNNVYYLTVTAPPNILPTTETQQTPQKSKKKAIVLTARVHPGETPASWMMKGMIDFLTGDSNQARELREKFIFKIIPMLNPDGVIVGNNRCSLTGRDLNRQYRTVIRETYPSVWHTKLMLRRLIEECGVAMYCDLHAHSRKHNVFVYGCESKRTAENRLQEQVFPLMLHKNSADKFSFENCKFRIQKTKEGTGRVVVWLLGVANSYTLEASFSGSTLGNRVQTHFTTQDLESVGRSFCETLLDFSDDHPSKEKLRLKIVTRLLKGGSSADEPTNINLSDYSSDEGDTSSSDSEERLVLPDPCCVPLQAPPPSPMPSKRQTRKAKQTKTSKTAKSPTVPRQILPVYRQTLDWPTTDPGSDFYDSADERLGFSPPSKHKGRRRTRYGDGFRSELEYHRMPPELMVIGEKSSCGRFNRPRSQSVADLNVTEKHKKPWHRLRSLPSRNVRSQPEELQVKLTSLRQRIWEGTNDDTNSPLSWGLGLSVLLATAYQNDCEELLRSCSQKLVALKKHDENTKKGHNVNKKIKKKAKSIKIPVVDESTTKVNSNKKKVKLKRQKAINDVKFEIQTIKAPIGIMGPYLQPQPSTSKSLVPSKLKLKNKTALINQDRESESEEAIAKRALNKKKKKRKK